MDLHKILQDLEAKAVGLKPGTDELQEGFFVSFRKMGLPIREHDHKGGLEDIFEDAQSLDEMQSTEEVKLPDYGDGVDGLKSDVKVEGKEPHSKEMNYLRTFVLSNDKIKMNKEFYVEPGTSKVSDTWEGVLRGATMDISNIKGNEEVEKAFKALEEKITPEMIDKMDKAEAKYNRALEELVEKYTESRYEGRIGEMKWRRLGRMYQSKVDRYAKQRRLASQEYDRLTAILDANGVDPAAFLISNAKDRFEKWKIQLGAVDTVPYTFMSPSDWYDPLASGWTKYTEKQYKEQVKIKNSSKDFGVKLGLQIGIWNVGGKGGYSRTKESMDTNVENLNISFEYMVARVNRPWMDTSFLRAKNWYLKSSGEQQYEVGCVSDGTFEQQTNNTENIFLPSAITGLILIKDLNIEWGQRSESIDKMTKSLEANGAIGIGPFSIGPSYKSSDSESEKNISDDGKTLSAKGVQLIGYVSEIIPKSPYLASK